MPSQLVINIEIDRGNAQCNHIYNDDNRIRQNTSNISVRRTRNEQKRLCWNVFLLL